MCEKAEDEATETRNQGDFEVTRWKYTEKYKQNGKEREADTIKSKIISLPIK